MIDNKDTNKAVSIHRMVFLLLAVVITAVGAYLRFWHIEDMPCGLFPDHAISLLEAAKLPIQPFYYSYGSHEEGLFILLLKGVFAFLGQEWGFLFALTAFLGTLTIPIFIASIRKTEGRFVALIAGLVMAASPWHIALSRSGFRMVMVPLVITLFYWAIVSFFQKPSGKRAMVAGIFLGSGLYVYSSYSTAMPLFLLAVCAISLLIWRFRAVQFVKVYKTQLLVGMVALILIVLPYAFFFTQHYQTLRGRMQQVSAFSGRSTKEGLSLVAGQLGQTLKGFFVEGDANWRHNFDTQPMIPPVFSLFFIVGIVTILVGKMPGGRVVDRRIYLLAFVIFLIPAVATIEGAVPHGNRLLGVLPVVFLLTGIGAYAMLFVLLRLVRFLDKRGASTSFVSLVPVFFIGASLAGLAFYAHGIVTDAYNRPEIASYFRCDLTDAATYVLRDQGIRSQVANGGKVYFIASSYERISLDFFLLTDPYFGIDENAWREMQKKPSDGYAPVPTKIERIGKDTMGNVEISPGSLVIVPAYSEFNTGIPDALIPQNEVLDGLKSRYQTLSLRWAFPAVIASRYPQGMAFWVYSL